MRPTTPGTRRPRGSLRPARGWIGAGALLAIVAIGFGLDYWRSPAPIRGERPPSAPVTCEAMPRALTGAFADEGDCALIERALRQALATAAAGTVTRWTNTRSRASGTIKLADAESRDGTVCRRAELTVTRGAETRRADAVLCLKRGTWVAVE